MRAIINGLAPCLRHRFEQLLDEPWDIIQIEHSYSFQPFEKALQTRRLPFVLSEHNLESVMGAACHDRLPLWLRPLNAFDRWRYRRWEQRVLRQPSEVVAVSAHDAELISHISGRPVNVVVNGVDCDFYRTCTLPTTASAYCSLAISNTAPTSKPSNGHSKKSCLRSG